MAELNFTPEQRAAIDTRGSTVLVSAAAGSGKTRVLLSSLRIAKERGARVILMTANSSDRLAGQFDEVLHVASDAMLDAGISISPQFPLLIMGDILFSYYLHTDLFRKRAIHSHTVEVLKERM